MKVWNTIISGIFITIGILLPIFFHAVGLGAMFLPMHLPVLVGGFLLGGFQGFLIGFLTPILSALLTGMPPLYPPVALLMMFELGTYGLISGVLGKKPGLNVFISLVITLVGGRIVSGIVAWIMLPLFGLPRLPIWAPFTAGLIKSFPGIIIQLILVPTLVISIRKALEKRRGT
ncbi:MAG: ECF transporter S component, partial [Candidatus Eremiobacteraeota bacterium]|nr:ECF transporter S component [Candidatus Eremiobacteraeota bacterium]